MTRTLIITLFLLAVTCNGLAAVSPHLDSDSGCSAVCCQAARHGGKQAAMSRLCCLTNCEHPAGTHSSSPLNRMCLEKHKHAAGAVMLSGQGSFSGPGPVIESREMTGRRENDLYLKIGALLI